MWLTVAIVFALDLSGSMTPEEVARVSDAMREFSKRLAEHPAVFAVMHLAWGFGFLSGCVRFGPPLAGVARALGLRRL